MSTKQDVLRLLYGTTNKPLSGQEIAEELNLSRTAVWKAIQQLKKDGYEIDPDQPETLLRLQPGHVARLGSRSGDHHRRPHCAHRTPDSAHAAPSLA